MGFDFHSTVVTVLKDEHAVVTFEIVKDDNHVTVVSVLVLGYIIEMVKQLSRAFESVEGYGILVFVGFQTDHDGCLVAFCISDGFVVTIDLQRWISFDPTIVRVFIV